MNPKLPFNNLESLATRMQTRLVNRGTLDRSSTILVSRWTTVEKVPQYERRTLLVFDCVSFLACISRTVLAIYLICRRTADPTTVSSGKSRQRGANPQASIYCSRHRLELGLAATSQVKTLLKQLLQTTLMKSIM